MSQFFRQHKLQIHLLFGSACLLVSSLFLSSKSLFFELGLKFLLLQLGLHSLDLSLHFHALLLHLELLGHFLSLDLQFLRSPLLIHLELEFFGCLLGLSLLTQSFLALLLLLLAHLLLLTHFAIDVLLEFFFRFQFGHTLHI